MLVLGLVIGLSVIFVLLWKICLSEKVDIDNDVLISLKYVVKHKITLSEYDLIYHNQSDPGYFFDKIEMFKFLNEFLSNFGISKYISMECNQKFVQYTVFINYKENYSRAMLTVINNKKYISIEPCDKKCHVKKAKLFVIK